MSKRLYSFVVMLMLLAGLAVPLGRGQAAPVLVVRGVLFYAPDCSHCHEVMEVVLPPLVAKYGDQLDIVGVDVRHSVGEQLYQSMLATYSVPDERVGVPTLVVGDQVLVGSGEIPELLPGMIERGLMAGGVDWPVIPGLEAVLAAQGAAVPVSSGAASGSAGSLAGPAQDDGGSPLVQKFMQDPIANTIAVIVELLMLAAVFYVLAKYLQGRSGGLLNWPRWAIPVLSVLGIAVAGYLSYTYLLQEEVLCGPVGDCGSVQESEYAYLFGVLPVGVLGLAGYLGILAAWWVQHFGPLNLRKPATLALWGMAWFGILFSLYLTFLEPFVIGASCAWCLTSAVLMTLVFLASSGPAIQAMKIAEDDDYADEDEEIVEARGKA